MKLEPGKDIYPLTDFGELILAVIDTAKKTRTGRRVPLFLISPAEWVIMRGDISKPPIQGIPEFISLIGPSPNLCLYPAPEKDWELIVRYHPQQRTL